MNPIVILLFNYSIIVINRLSLGPSIGSSDHSYFSVNPGWRKCLFSRWHYASIPVELLWQIVTIEFAALLSVWRRVTVTARGLNSIKCIDYLSLLHDNNATRHYTTCPPSLLCWQFLGVKATTDLLALRTNGSKHRGGFKVVCNIRFLLAPCSRPLTFQNLQIPSHLRPKSKVDKVGP